mmetsp:Transcript_22735/g.52591  ORF Transcript_22735/g.52591 Transcript_22735/m.52591 type:complete len:570 (-) Transcript_22735:294-2003(-)
MLFFFLELFVLLCTLFSFPFSGPSSCELFFLRILCFFLMLLFFLGEPTSFFSLNPSRCSGDLCLFLMLCFLLMLLVFVGGPCVLPSFSSGSLCGDESLLLIALRCRLFSLVPFCIPSSSGKLPCLLILCFLLMLLILLGVLCILFSFSASSSRRSFFLLIFLLTPGSFFSLPSSWCGNISFRLWLDFRLMLLFLLVGKSDAVDSFSSCPSCGNEFFRIILGFLLMLLCFLGTGGNPAPCSPWDSWSLLILLSLRGTGGKPWSLLMLLSLLGVGGLLAFVFSSCGNESFLVMLFFFLRLLVFFGTGGETKSLARSCSSSCSLLMLLLDLLGVEGLSVSSALSKSASRGKLFFFMLLSRIGSGGERTSSLSSSISASLCNNAPFMLLNRLGAGEASTSSSSLSSNSASLRSIVPFALLNLVSPGCVIPASVCDSATLAETILLFLLILSFGLRGPGLNDDDDSGSHDSLGNLILQNASAASSPCSSLFLMTLGFLRILTLRLTGLGTFSSCESLLFMLLVFLLTLRLRLMGLGTTDSFLTPPGEPFVTILVFLRMLRIRLTGLGVRGLSSF